MGWRYAKAFRKQVHRTPHRAPAQVIVKDEGGLLAGPRHVLVGVEVRHTTAGVVRHVGAIGLRPGGDEAAQHGRVEAGRQLGCNIHVKRRVVLCHARPNVDNLRLLLGIVAVVVAVQAVGRRAEAWPVRVDHDLAIKVEMEDGGRAQPRMQQREAWGSGEGGEAGG